MLFVVSALGRFRIMISMYRSSNWEVVWGPCRSVRFSVLALHGS